MNPNNKNAKLDRVEHQLRSDGVREIRNPFLSGVHTRGYLPHVKREGASYFVTFRLADSLPRNVLSNLRQRHEEALKIAATQTDKHEANKEFRRALERYLDKGAGKCYLANEDVASRVAKALQHFNEQQYVLDDWVIMPNHVHLLIWPMPNHTLTDILRSRKTFTAREANLVLGRSGTFWQPESYDHWIRNDEEKTRIRRYIRNNPVNAGLCKSPEEWRWSSAWQDEHAG